MTYFSDRSPQQEMLEAAEAVKDNFSLSDEELVTVLIQVLSAVNDPAEIKADDLKKREVNRG